MEKVLVLEAIAFESKGFDQAATATVWFYGWVLYVVVLSQLDS